ncbi:unnamed protein product [Linum trigynum]|uniref:Secreted protein n=1 Tax=Linum trigynum TaxID=586398 RepID=A0AAV2GWP9_9ROSI
MANHVARVLAIVACHMFGIANSNVTRLLAVIANDFSGGSTSKLWTTRLHRKCRARIKSMEIKFGLTTQAGFITNQLTQHLLNGGNISMKQRRPNPLKSRIKLY